MKLKETSGFCVVYIKTKLQSLYHHMRGRPLRATLRRVLWFLVKHQTHFALTLHLLNVSRLAAVRSFSNSCAAVLDMSLTIHLLFLAKTSFFHIKRILTVNQKILTSIAKLKLEYTLVYSRSYRTSHFMTPFIIWLHSCRKFMYTMNN